MKFKPGQGNSAFSYLGSFSEALFTQALVDRIAGRYWALALL